MKKIILTILTSSLLVLTACQPSQESKSSVPTSVSSSKQANSSSSASTTTSSSSQTETSNQTIAPSSSAMATPKPQAESQPPAPSNEELYATTLHLVATDTTAGRATHYAFVDIDGNGTAELLTSHFFNGQVSPAALYYLQNRVPTYLARTYVAGAGGGREGFVIYQDGTVESVSWHSASGQGTATLYQLSPDNSGHWVIGEADFDMRASGVVDPYQFNQGRAILDMDSLSWTAF